MVKTVLRLRNGFRRGFRVFRKPQVLRPTNSVRHRKLFTRSRPTSIIQRHKRCMTKSVPEEEDDLTNRSTLYKFLHKTNIVASPGFNRWLMPVSSVSIHVCIGSVYAWSIFNPALTREFGVVCASAADWPLTSVVWVFSTAIVNL